MEKAFGDSDKAEVTIDLNKVHDLIEIIFGMSSAYCNKAHTVIVIYRPEAKDWPLFWKPIFWREGIKCN